MSQKKKHNAKQQAVPQKLLQIQQVFEYYAAHHGPDGKKPNRAQRRAAAQGIKCGKNTAGSNGKKRTMGTKRQRLTIG